MMRMLGVTVGYDHFCQGKPVEDWSFVAFVVVGDVVQDDAFAVVEADVDFPILPVDDPAVHSEGYAFRLGDVDWFQIFSIASVGFDGGGVVIEGGRLVQGSADWWDVDVDDILGVGVEYRGEV